MKTVTIQIDYVGRDYIEVPYNPDVDIMMEAAEDRFYNLYNDIDALITIMDIVEENF